MQTEFDNAVLLDNSTVYGAKDAYEASSQLYEEGGLSGSAEAKFRALMDILEGIVLHEKLVVEPRQGDYDLWEGLAELQARDGSYVLRQEAVEDEEARPALLHMALDRLAGYLRSDAFVEDAASFVEADKSIIPLTYTRGYDLESAIRRDFFWYLSPEAQTRVDQVSSLLQNADLATKNFAAFAFGGFFYHAVAHTYSVSYVPHTWRSALIDRSMAARDLDFSRYAVGLASDVREALVTRLNTEFGQEVVDQQFPVVASYIIDQANRRSDLLDTAVEIRDTSSARAFRTWTSEVQSSIQGERDLPRVKEANRELRQLAEDLRREFGMGKPSARQDFTIKAQAPGGFLSIETDVGVPKSAPTWLRRILHRRTHLVFLRDVARRSVSLTPFIKRFWEMPQ